MKLWYKLTLGALLICTYLFVLFRQDQEKVNAPVEKAVVSKVKIIPAQKAAKKSKPKPVPEKPKPDPETAFKNAVLTSPTMVVNGDIDQIINPGPSSIWVNAPLGHAIYYGSEYEQDAYCKKVGVALFSAGFPVRDGIYVHLRSPGDGAEKIRRTWVDRPQLEP